MSQQAQGIIPHLVVDDAARAIAFYQKAFGATEILRVPADDGTRLMHAELVVNGARLYLRDDFPELCTSKVDNVRPPKVSGATGVTLHLDVENCDKAVAKAQAAGATVIMAPWDAFWGARYAQIIDPHGHSWSLAHPLPGAGSEAVPVE